LLLVCDLESCDFIQFKPKNEKNAREELSIINIPRDRDWMSKQWDTLTKFWEEVNVEKQNAPKTISFGNEDTNKQNVKKRKTSTCKIID
tara:strand:+ start:244 stop:510 length:267 start_codon:yes stop_codon:yes gene_type:complete